jgi:hypothetical protein
MTTRKKLTPTQKYNFLTRNIGRWSWRSDNIEMTREDGSKFKPGGSFSMNGSGYLGYTLDEAIELAYDDDLKRKKK